MKKGVLWFLKRSAHVRGEKYVFLSPKECELVHSIRDAQVQHGLNALMNSMKLVIPLDSLYWSIHTKDESKRGSAFAFIFDVN